MKDLNEGVRKVIGDLVTNYGMNTDYCDGMFIDKAVNAILELLKESK